MAASRSFEADHGSTEENTPQDAAAADPQPLADAAPSPLGDYPQAGVVVDDQLDVLEFLGNTVPYLRLPIGKARLSLRLMLQPALQHPVLESVRQVRESGGTVRRERLAMAAEAKVRRVNVEVSLLERHPSGRPAIRVLFQDAQTRPAAARSTTPGMTGPARLEPKDLRVTRLKDELVMTRATLESIIEEQEIGTARLKSAYYQLESVNAELEAANEELAAANIELEALNEQLEGAIRQRDAAEGERDRMEAEFIQAQRLDGLRVMAGGVAHDFNNLLTSIVGNADVLLEELPAGSESWDAAEQIEKAGQHATALVRQMLAFCGKGNFAAAPLGLSELVRESVDLLRASISKGTELRCELSEDLPPIEADATQLRQVLINLVVNASEAIGNVAGVIRVSTRRLDVPPGKSFRISPSEMLGPGAYVCLEVADTGNGMSDEAKAKLFEPFFSTKFAGRGLGLAAVLGIVRGHRGAVQVHSRQTQGAEIEVLFPAAPGAVAPPAEPKTAAERPAGGTVLVVDDEESIRTIASAILKRGGMEVIAVAGGEEALQILRRDRSNGAKVSTVLLDLVMPRMSGNEMLKQLRTFAPELPVILSSGYSEESDAAARLAALGPTSFLAKPYRPAELLEAVCELLAGQLERNRAVR